VEFSVDAVLLGIGLIIVFGYFAELVYRKLKVPDVLLLVVLGFVIGPYCFGYVSVEQFAAFSPVFTAFTLIFLLFDGAFNIDLVSIAKGIYYGSFVTMFNFIISSAVITGIMFWFGFDFIVALMTGFILGGVSSSVVIPLLKQISVKKDVFSLLTFESAFTDVICIVAALAVMDLIAFGDFQLRAAASNIVALFAVAAIIGILAGVMWVVLELHHFVDNKSYMLTISFMVLVVVLTNFLNGNGAIAALFFGLVLGNSKQLMSISRGIVSKSKCEKKKALTGELGISVTTPSELFFYHQISFFVKTFFFVYVGVLLDLSNRWFLVIGLVVAFALFMSRRLSSLVTGRFDKHDRSIINAISARGLAAVALVQIAIQRSLAGASEIAIIVYIVVVATLVLSSLNIFLISLLRGEVEVVPEPAPVKK